MADVHVHVWADAGRSGRAELKAHRCRVVCGHRGSVRRHRDVGLRRRTRSLCARPGAGGHAFHGANARGRGVLRYRIRDGRARHGSPRGSPVDAQCAALQTGKTKIEQISKILLMLDDDKYFRIG